MRTRIIAVLVALLLMSPAVVRAIGMLRFAVETSASVPESQQRRNLHDTVLKGCDEGFFTLLKVFTESVDQCRTMIRKGESVHPNISVDIRSFGVSGGSASFELQFRTRTPWGGTVQQERKFLHPQAFLSSGYLKPAVKQEIYKEIERFVILAAAAQLSEISAMLTPPPAQETGCRSVFASKVRKYSFPESDVQ